ncbi:MAG: outer membrane lipoprotein-sorting protein [Desulfatibacillaceae bacterium]
MRIACIAMAFLFALPSALAAAERTADEIISAAQDQWRGDTSEATLTMVIHRPDWERTMTIKAFTRGADKSIFWITEPPRDAGNGTLKRGTDMWTYNPKVNRVIKLPPSMMSQSWMGSDFSNHDLSRSDTIVRDYDHSIAETREEDGHTVYVIESPAKPTAPVIWGSLRFEIRDDDVLLKEEYYDEDGVMVKQLVTERIEEMGGRLLPVVMKMERVEESGDYTKLIYEEVAFDMNLPDNMFTRASLRNPRR